ncbi:hypothetical protein HDU79_007967 [Rhizoclosmatium sp. JEL0117]|nr:hypothetical protein HDU79_007967 [Rhizoclosmatium sp. JEL0117]
MSHRHVNPATGEDLSSGQAAPSDLSNLKPDAPSRADSDETIQNGSLYPSNSPGVTMGRSTKYSPATPTLRTGVVDTSARLTEKKPTPQLSRSKDGGGSGKIGSFRSNMDRITKVVGLRHKEPVSDDAAGKEFFNQQLVVEKDSEDAISTASSIQQPQPVPPPIKNAGFFKKSIPAFPVTAVAELFVRPNSAAPASPSRSNKSPKRSSSTTSTMQKLNNWRASASDFFNNTVLKRRGFSADQHQQTADDTGGETTEEIPVQHTATSSTHISTKSLAQSSAAVLNNVIGAVNQLKSNVTETISRVNSARPLRPANALAPLTGHHHHVQHVPEPPPKPKPQESGVDQRKKEGSVKKVSQKEKEDEERNSRHADVVGFLNGTRPLSARFRERYRLGEVLGDGAFGFVMTATRLVDGKEVAVKFITRDKIPRDLWVKDPSNPSEKIPVEIAILQQLSHPNIIQYIDHIIEPSKYILLITELHGTEWTASNAVGESEKAVAKEVVPVVMEKKRAASENAKSSVTPVSFPKTECSPLFRLTAEQEKQIKRRTSCDLFECIDAHKRIPEPLAKKIFAQIALAVHFLHSNNLVHRDLKDENVVIDSNYIIKIIDFGSAAQIPKHERDYFTKFNGTTHFASPEIANQLSYRGPESEMWSLGVLLYTIVFGENPFHTIPDIIRGEFRIPFGLESDSQIEGCRHLIRRLLAYNPRERATIDEVLSHKWLCDEVEKLREQYASVTHLQ